MKKNTIIPILITMFFVLSFYATHTLAIYRKSIAGNGSLPAASWSVSRSESTSGDSLQVIPELATDTYNLTVQSNSEVDVVYNIIISNLPSGIEVIFDNDTNNALTPTNGTITISGGTINYNDSIKTKNHTLTFRATSGAQFVSNREIDIDVEFRQTLQ